MPTPSTGMTRTLATTSIVLGSRRPTSQATPVTSNAAAEDEFVRLADEIGDDRAGKQTADDRRREHRGECSKRWGGTQAVQQGVAEEAATGSEEHELLIRRGPAVHGHVGEPFPEHEHRQRQAQDHDGGHGHPAAPAAGERDHEAEEVEAEVVRTCGDGGRADFRHDVIGGAQHADAGEGSTQPGFAIDHARGKRFIRLGSSFGRGRRGVLEDVAGKGQAAATRSSKPCQKVFLVFDQPRLASMINGYISSASRLPALEIA